ncbi:phage minor head protein [Moraxella equi]|uniref:Phage head morphogenesis protein, SPP1 gp7 family n=1 Tax=Moraxella equi TaxID=60442 RepID=A0A378QRV2_9GAMM|nr:phage minor head protein [Moraxella equi]OPH36005.1 hypothetical protein B5J93_09990 [Moraxella equi]STZ03636.1 phage head morphogenesis protein, SPP1 gp7 family [Moraxella equi]
MVYHTNKQTAYSAGKWERIQKTKDFLPFLQYLPSASVNKRDGHKAYYGIVRPVDDPIWQSIFPPNGFGCRCAVKQISKSKALELGITDDDKINKLPVPDFDSNFDRLGSLLRLAEDKHGVAFADKLGADLKDEMIAYAVKAGVARQKLSHILPNSQNALNLAKDPNGKSRLSEGVLADQWEQFHKVKLERYDGGKHKVLVQNDPADYAIVDLAQEPTAWVTLDFMFTLEPDANKAEFNRSFYKSDKAWEKRQNRILQHLAKADFVPMYLRYLDSKALVKIIGFVLSLPKDLQEKIILIE